MRKCSRCGNKIKEGDRYCIVCGAPYWMSKPSFWSSPGGKLLIGALSLVLVAGLVLGAWLLFRDPDDGSTKSADGGETAKSSSETAQILPERTSEAEKEQERTEASLESLPDTEAQQETEEASSSERSNEPAVNTETSEGPQAETTKAQTTEESTVDGKAQIRGIVDAKDSADIKWIINRFREVSDHLDRFESRKMEDGTRYYEKGTKNLVCVQLFRNNIYEEYYYDNGQLFFADYYYEWGTWRGLTRFYYKDGMLIRYSEKDNGPTHDYPDGLDPELFRKYSGERDLYTIGIQEMADALR